MTKSKVKYQEGFLRTTSEETLNIFWSFIEDNKEKILDCYEALIDEDEFVKMIFYDALFIVELFLRKYHEKKKGKSDPRRKDFLLNETWSAGLRRDLILLENQIPLFVLEQLYDSYRNFPAREHDELDSASDASALPFLQLACFYLDIPWNEEFKDKSILHFTDLKRCHLVQNHPEIPSSIPPDWKTLQHSAIMLDGAGVKLTVHENACMLDIKVEGKEIKIPKLTVHSNTEAYIRNVMAFEMCHNPREAYVCAYIQLMNYLIKSCKDVDLLLNKGILSKEGGNEGILFSRINISKMMAGMIKKLMQGVGKPPACYRKTGHQLNQLYNEKLKIALYIKENLGILKRVYFANLWRGTATVAAFMVVVFTLIQTVLAFRK